MADKEKKEKKKPSFVLGVDLPATEKFSSGLLALDKALDGGFVVGSIVEIFGEESDGKSTLGIQVLAEGQEKGFNTLYIDAEHSTTREYLGNFLDLKKLYYERPASGEEAYNRLRDFWSVHKDEKCIILIDSVAALIPETQVESGDSNYGPVASLMSKNIPSILRGYRNSIVIFINQVRTNISSGWGGGGTKTTGGWALKFYAGHRIKLDTRKLIIDDDKKPIGKTVQIEIVKNKFGVPFRSCTLEFYFGGGYSKIYDLVAYAISEDIVRKSGAWYEFNGERWQGENSLVESVTKDRDLFNRIKMLCQGGQDNGRKVGLH